MSSFSSSIIVRFLLAPLLIFWVAGAGCMLGCEGTVAAATATEQQPSTALHSAQAVTIVASGHACSSGTSSSHQINTSHSCCKKDSAEVKPKALRSSTGFATLVQSDSSSSGMMKDCPLAGSKTAVVIKSGSGNSEASPAVAHSYLSAQNFLEQAPPSTSPRLPNRGHTYLRCCVFLI